MDTCVIPLRHGGLSLVQTTDYIYPIVDDPYMMVNTHFRVTLKIKCIRLEMCHITFINNIFPTMNSLGFQGRIACANVLSDLYAMGVTECDNMLMLLGVSNKLTEKVRQRKKPCETDL